MKCPKCDHEFSPKEAGKALRDQGPRNRHLHLTQERRKEIATKAIKTRWERVRAAKAALPDETNHQT